MAKLGGRLKRGRGLRAVALAALLTLGFAAGRAIAAPYQPQVGDELRYGVSNGDVAITRVIRTRGHGDRVYAQVVQTLLRKGADPQTSRFTVIRTEEGMAIQVSTSMEGLELSPLVYYLKGVAPQESWLAQKGSFRNSNGKTISYELRAELQGLETIRVPAGTFQDCARISYRTRFAEPGSGSDAELIFWVKPEIGIVKTRSLQEGQVTETELLSFQRAAFAHP